MISGLSCKCDGRRSCAVLDPDLIRGLAMHITNLDKVAKIIPDMEGAKDIYKQIPISRDNGTPAFSFRVFTIQPGGHTPLHNHPSEHLNYVIEGNGTVMTEDGARQIEKGDFILVLPGETHQYRNTSTNSPLVIICAVPKEYE
jgi:quercetin dioxygenase-like cupin family protein